MIQSRIFIIPIILSTICVKNSYTADKFPILEFYGDDILELLKDDPLTLFTLEDEYLCMNSTKLTPKYCSCQSSCILYGTCCIDYFWYKTKWNGLKEYLTYFIKKQLMYYSCMPLIDNNNGNNNKIKMNIENVIMVQKCPTINGYTPGSTQLLPLFGNDNKIYMNPSIALCHDVKEYNLLPITATCDKANQTASSTTPEFSSCTYENAVPENLKKYVKTCFSKNSCSHKRHRSTEDERNTELCRNYGGQIQINNKQYNNIHCSKCKNLTKPLQIKFGKQMTPLKTIVPMPYSAVISYGMGQPTISYDNNGNTVEQKLNCKTNELYDIIRKQCIPFQCSSGFIQMGFQCKKIDTTKDDSNTGIGLLDDLSTRIRKCLFSDYNNPTLIVITNNVSRSLSRSLFNTANQFKSAGRSNIYQISLENPNRFDIINKKLQNMTTTKNKIQIKAILSQRVINTQLYGFNSDRSFPEGKICFQSIHQNLSTLKIDPDCTMTSNNSSYSPKDYLLKINLSSTNKSEEIIVIICKEYHLHQSCPKISIPANDYIIYENGTVYIPTENNSYNVTNYTPLTKGIGICIDHYITGTSTKEKPDWQKNAEKIEGYITIIACFISIIFYILVINVYLRTKELREIPGRNIVCICIALLLSDAFILSASFTDRGTFSCYILATLLHCFLLSAQAWSNVISFEIWFTLRKHTSARFIYTPKRFYWYCAYGFLIPLFMVTIFSTLDSTKVLGIGYGSSTHCWINNFYFKLYLYLIPVAIASCFNIFVLVFILYQIYKQEKESSKLLNKTSDHDEARIIKTALKLMLLLGIVEIIGFIQIPENNEDWKIALNLFIRYLFTILRGFRGLFIWLLFVYMDKRAWVQQKCNTRSYSPQDTPTFATKSSRVSYKINQNVIDTKM